jgi:DNA-binding GntR family transcriptional regulator
MARVLEVSRATIQRAIDRLVLDEVVYYQQGKGIFVAAPAEHEHLPVLQSISQSLRALGYEVHADLLIMEEIEPSGHIVDILSLEPYNTVIQIKRLQYLDGEPMVLQEAYVEAMRFRDIMNHNLRDQSLTKLVQEVGDTRIMGSSLIVSARETNWEESRLLNIPAGISLLSIEEVDYDDCEQPVRYNRNKLRSDRFRLIAKSIPEHKISLEFRRQPGIINIELS